MLYCILWHGVAWAGVVLEDDCPMVPAAALATLRAQAPVAAAPPALKDAEPGAQGDVIRDY